MNKFKISLILFSLLLIGMSTLAQTELQEAPVVSCDAASGFYDDPFTARLAAETGGKIKFTLDGSDPRNSATAITGQSVINVNINPTSTQGGRGKTGGVVLRATQIVDGLEPAQPVTRNFIFIESVKTQQHPGSSWPAERINGQVIDLEMDPNITTDSRYKDLIHSSLLDIPTISISTDQDNLFGPEKGIYVNAQYHGIEWERPANIELINPDGSEGFNIDAGIRIRGGWSRHDDFPKHAFRVFFRSEYGEGKLHFPLFGKEGVDEFDKIDLRCSQNYSWANGGSQSKYNTMNRDVFSRDTQRDMNQPYTRSRYYHLYLNGLYWGVFETQERAEANFAESYFGGDKDDYDVIKVDIGQNWDLYEIEATDGNTDAWEEIYNMCNQGFASNLNYFRLLGQNFRGEPDTSKNVYVDIDNFIDYMLVIFYTGNFDAPVSKFSNNYNPNNFFAIYNRADKREGFKFLTHDSEHTLFVDPVNPGSGLYENRVDINMNVNYFGKFQPQWLHEKLTENKEYRIKFADRVYRHFFNNGVFNPDSCIARFSRKASQLDLAVIAESARWGDAGSWPARNKTDDWLPAVEQITNDFMPYRTQLVLNQLLAEDLYVDEEPPVFKNNGNEILEQTLISSGNINLTVENAGNSGTVFYTTDGTDPRAIGGSKSASAIDGGNLSTISISPGSKIMARALNGDVWSPLHELNIEDSGLFSNLKITELHYHPADQGEVDDKELEFLELKNTGTAPLDLSGLAFTDGISLTFPAGTVIEPGTFLVLASNVAEFEALYGIAANFQYSGSLANEGERVVLETATGETVLDFTFSDDEPWPVEADGDGYSLVTANANPQGDPNLAEYWALSNEINGSPFSDDSNSITAAPVIASNTFDWNVYPNPASSIINIDFLLETDETIEIGLYDFNGRFLQALVREQLPAGTYNREIQLNQLNLDAGMYLITLRSESDFATKKLVYNRK